MVLGYDGGNALQRDWTRISEMARYVALLRDTDASLTKLFFGKGTMRQRSKRLREARAAADTATEAVTTMVDRWGPLADPPGQAKAVLELRDWADAVISRLAYEREGIERRRALLPVPAKRGKPDQPETYRLKVMAAYFRHHGWIVSSSMNGKFALSCEAVTTGILAKPINPTLLKDVIASRYPYTLLLAETRPFGQAARRTITFPVSQ